MAQNRCQSEVLSELLTGHVAGMGGIEVADLRMWVVPSFRPRATVFPWEDGTMSSITIALGLVSALLVAAQAVGDKPAQAGSGLKASELVGGYTIVSGEKFGLEEPEERIKGSTVRFSDDRVVVTDKDKKEVYGATYELEPGEGKTR